MSLKTSVSAVFVFSGAIDGPTRIGNQRMQSILQKEGNRMSPNYKTEHDTDADYAAGVWAEEGRPVENRAPLPWESRAPAPSGTNPHQVAARGFAQMFALHPGIAFFAIIVDAMVTAIDVSTLEITAPVLWLIAATVVSVVVYRGQMKFAGDDSETSLIKSLMVGFLVALPTPFPAFLTVPSAIAGTVQILKNRK
jgi:hypothetical protein